jgi:hypothetical protein
MYKITTLKCLIFSILNQIELDISIRENAFTQIRNFRITYTQNQVSISSQKYFPGYVICVYKFKTIILRTYIRV